MIILLRALHSIAAPRGDGLHPKLLRVVAPSPAWADVERLGSAANVNETGAKPVNETERDGQSADGVSMPLQKRA
jgi:hypothetical protein